MSTKFFTIELPLHRQKKSASLLNCILLIAISCPSLMMVSTMWIKVLLASNLAAAIPNPMPAGSSVEIGVNQSPTAVMENTSVSSETPQATYRGPLATLQPATHWNQDLADLNNLKPMDSHDTHFTGSGVAG